MNFTVISSQVVSTDISLLCYSAVAVSAATGEGMDDVITAITECAEQYKKEYIPMYKKVLEEKKKIDEEEKKLKQQVDPLLFMNNWKLDITRERTACHGT